MTAFPISFRFSHVMFEVEMRLWAWGTDGLTRPLEVICLCAHLRVKRFHKEKRNLVLINVLMGLHHLLSQLKILTLSKILISFP